MEFKATTIFHTVLPKGHVSQWHPIPAALTFFTFSYDLDTPVSTTYTAIFSGSFAVLSDNFSCFFLFWVTEVCS